MEIRNKKNTVEWLDDGDTAAFTASIKGGDLPDGEEWKIYFELYGFNNAEVKDWREFVAGGRSGRVILADTLRKSKDTKLMDRLQRDGCRIRFTQVDELMAFQTIEEQAAMLASKLTPEQKAALWAELNK